MADALERRPALPQGLPARHGAETGAPGLVLREAPPVTVLRVQTCNTEEKPPGDKLGITLPVDPGASTLMDGVRAICLTSADWLLIYPDEDAQPVEALRARIGDDGAVTDETGAALALVVEGARAESVLQKGIAVDLSPTAFPVDRALQAGLAEVHVLLLREAETRFRLHAPRSLAASLLHWLLETGAPFGVEVVG
ncbi:MAG: hypothetical protein KDG89_15845 [Geminicoccaceae bacterium]|nr:hypothetical protein [Geminicoccaceae bacterium]